MATKSKPKATKPEANGTPPSVEGVLTLAEAAKLLRVSEEGLKADVVAGRVPCRLVAGEWRFTKAALFEWLSQPEAGAEEKKKTMMSVIGAFKDDETLEPMVEEIYRRRREHPLP